MATTLFYEDGLAALGIRHGYRPEAECEMSIRRIVPDIASKDIDASRKFYTDLVGLSVAMDMGFVVTLVSPANPTAQVTLIRDEGAASVQPNISIEVADVDEIHGRAVAQGREIVYPLTDEPWGVRRFFVNDPSGVVINVLSHRINST
jgi:predicted enzyme related to lactoylglutathione lyase